MFALCFRELVVTLLCGYQLSHKAPYAVWPRQGGIEKTRRIFFFKETKALHISNKVSLQAQYPHLCITPALTSI